MARTASKTAAPARKVATKASTKKASTPKVTAPAPATEEEVARRRGTVVGLSFKQRYADKGDPNSNGDWMAIQLKELVPSPVQASQLRALAKANGVEDRYQKWVDGGKGNPGLHRMSLGLVLRAVVGETGVLKVPGEKAGRIPPKAFIAKHSH